MFFGVNRSSKIIFITLFSTAATHDLTSGKRDFTAEYLDIMNNFGMIPRMIALGEKKQNGDVEGMHRGLKGG